ncbi:hypothetical protein RSAG8_09068, partial [Rhizoctonia solani AG-8 WAC10335]
MRRDRLFSLLLSPHLRLTLHVCDSSPPLHPRCLLWAAKGLYAPIVGQK